MVMACSALVRLDDGENEIKDVRVRTSEPKSV